MVAMLVDSLPIFTVFDPKLAVSTLLLATFGVLDVASVTKLAISASLLTVLADSVADSLADSLADSPPDSLPDSLPNSLPDSLPGSLSDSLADALSDPLELEHPTKSLKVGGTKERKYYILIVFISITI